jgi:hypothetical protein
MTPVVADKVRPAGSAGEIVQEVTVPPVVDGVSSVIVVPFANEKKL